MAALEGEWRDLEDRVEQRTVFSTFDFLETWYSAYASSERTRPALSGDPLIGIARRGNRVVGVAPFVQRRGRLGRVPVTRIQFAVHDAHAGEFLVPVDEPGAAGAFIESLADSVHFDVISLIGLDPDSERFEAIAGAASRRLSPCQGSSLLHLVEPRRRAIDLHGCTIWSDRSQNHESTRGGIGPRTDSTM